jgi:hypothetical protein
MLSASVMCTTGTPAEDSLDFEDDPAEDDLANREDARARAQRSTTKQFFQ